VQELRFLVSSRMLNHPMKRWSLRPLVVILCALSCATAAAMSLWSLAGSVRTEDQNGDGRPDVWRVYDRQGQLSEVAVDTNFDGRPDVHEYYERSALVRRESDRDFNGRVDLVQEFEPTTHEHVRSVEDVDFDGTADLLVLFQGGRPVYQKWAHPVTPAAASGSSTIRAGASPRTADDQLAPFEDPFRTELALRAVRIAAGSGDCVGLSTSSGLPASRNDVVSPLVSSSGISASTFSHLSSAPVVPYSPRGPPVSLLLT
jgi:hypothetical protein